MIIPLFKMGHTKDDVGIDMNTAMGLYLDNFLTFFTRFKVYPHLMNRMFAWITDDVSEYFRDRLNAHLTYNFQDSVFELKIPDELSFVFLDTMSRSLFLHLNKAFILNIKYPY